HVHPEVRPGLDRPVVDARLDLTVEVALPLVLPTAVLGQERRGPAGGFGRRVEPEELQRLQGVHGGGPGLTGLVARVRGREAGPAVPEPVRAFERQQAGTPAFVLHPGPLGRDVAGRYVLEVAEHLPANG